MHGERICRFCDNTSNVIYEVKLIRANGYRVVYMCQTCHGKYIIGSLYVCRYCGNIWIDQRESATEHHYVNVCDYCKEVQRVQKTQTEPF